MPSSSAEGPAQADLADAARGAVGAQQDVARRAGERDRLRAREIAMAVAEAECARATRLVSIATQLNRTHRAQVTAEYEGLLIAYREQQGRALQRAKALLRAP